MKELTVDLGDRSYPIFIGSGVLQQAGFPDYVQGQQVMIITNETVAPLYLDKLRSRLGAFDVSETVLPDGEKFKTLDSINAVFNELLTNRHARDTTLFALGGGVIGDMAGFAAACYQRGVKFVQVPTTLLSQVDSSVGGKTGVNHSLGKNMIGAFHQPQAVFIDTDTLKTLDNRQLSAGMAEVIKYGLIRDIEFLSWLEKNMTKLLGLNDELITEAIFRSCQLKAEIVSEDEKEQGVRAILNLGHTFGHAIEAFTEYTSWLHGEAVAAGMIMAADLSARLGWIDEEHRNRVENVVSLASLPVLPPKEMTSADFKRFMSVDKKVINGRLRLVLLTQLGKAVVTDDFSIEAFNETLAKYTSH